MHLHTPMLPKNGRQLQAQHMLLTDKDINTYTEATFSYSPVKSTADWRSTLRASALTWRSSRCTSQSASSDIRLSLMAILMRMPPARPTAPHHQRERSTDCGEWPGCPAHDDPVALQCSSCTQYAQGASNELCTQVLFVHSAKQAASHP